MRKVPAIVAAISILAASLLAQSSGGHGGASFPAPGLSGLCWVSSSATAYGWGSCSGTASSNFSTLVPGTNATLGSFLFGNSTTSGTTGTGIANYLAGTQFTLQDPTDTTKRIQFNLANMTTATTTALDVLKITQSTVNDTNITLSLANNVLTAGWTGTLAAGRLNANVVQGVTNDTNVTGSISAQNLTLGWTGTLAAARLNANVVQSVTNDTNVTGSIAAQGLTLGWSGTLAKGRTLATTVYTDQSNTYSAGTQNFSGAAHTLPILVGLTASKPATCTTGEEYFATDATAGQNEIYCTATNTWTQETGGGGGGLPSGPTSPNGVAQTLTSTPSGGVAGSATWNLPGVPTNAQTGTTYTIAATDRGSYVTFSNAASIAVTLPQAGSSGFTSNFVAVACDIGAGTATITPTTSTISYTNGSTYTSAATSLALTTGQCAWIYSDNTNYLAILRGSGSGTVTTTGTPANGNLTKFSGSSSITNADLSGDVTTSSSLVTTVAKVNGTTVPTNAAADTVLGTTASATGSWLAVPNCGDSSHSLAYSTTTHSFSCQAITGSGGGVADPGANGIMVRTALNTTTARTLTAGSSDVSVTNGDGTGGNPTVDIAANVKRRAISFTIGDPGASSALTAATTTTAYVTVPFACTVSAYNLLVDAGTITVKFWKVATGTAIPTSTNSINTSGVSISSGTAIHSTTLTDFTTTSVSQNDIVAMNVTAVATAKYVNGVLECDQ